MTYPVGCPVNHVHHYQRLNRVHSWMLGHVLLIPGFVCGFICVVLALSFRPGHIKLQSGNIASIQRRRKRKPISQQS
jgi:UPF0716 family protein affecting phage T7 exclusion